MNTAKKLMLLALLTLALPLAFAQPDPALIPEGFSSAFAELGEVDLHYVSGGEGPPVMLVHGFASTWYEWRKVMPGLVEAGYQVIVPDLRGLGDSSVPTAGYDKLTAANDLYELAQSLGLETFYLVGHDIGLQIAFALATEHPEVVGKLVLLEAPIPDETIYTFPALTPAGPGAWHFGFFNLPDLPESLVAGQEREFHEYFVRNIAVNQNAFTDADFEEYARTYAQPDKLSAAFNYFRAFSEDVERNSALDETALSMPVLALGAEFSLGEFVAQQVSTYGTDVQGGVIEGSGHWIPEEAPEAFLDTLLTFLGGK